MIKNAIPIFGKFMILILDKFILKSYTLDMKKLLLKLIDIYQSMPLSSHSKCKYYPTCSNYAKEAITIHGAFKGTLLSIKRILKCNPFSKGGIDLVSSKK